MGYLLVNVDNNVFDLSLSLSSIAFTKSDTFSLLKDRIEVLKCNSCNETEYDSPDNSFSA